MLTAYAAQQVSDDTIARVGWLLDLLTQRIPLWIAAAIVVFLGFIVAKLARKVVEAKISDKVESDESQEIIILGGRLTYSTVLVLGLTVGLKIAGIDLTQVIAAVALGVGFALKDLIMNFLAGVAILVSRHFTIGDFIKIDGTLGKITEIQTRNTIMQAIDGTRVIVPNADLFTKQVISYTSNPFRRIEVIVGVDFRTNLENAVKVCYSALQKTKGVLLEPKPAVLVDEFGDSAINLKVRAWVESRGAWLKVKSDLVVNIKKEFDQYGITIPWPIRTVAYDKDQEMMEKIMEEEKSGKETSVENKAAQPAQNVQITGQVPVAPAQPAIPVQPVAQAVPVSVESDEDQPLKPLGEVSRKQG